jgi:hypothetical protein
VHRPSERADTQAQDVGLRRKRGPARIGSHPRVHAKRRARAGGMMKSAAPKRVLPRQALVVSVSTVSGGMHAVQPGVGLVPQETSLTFRGELTTPRKSKRPIVISVRQRAMPVGGRVYPGGRVLNVWVNLPPTLFSDLLTLGMSGALSSIELTTEKLRRDMGDVLGVRFATGELRNTSSAGIAGAVPSTGSLKIPRAPRRKARKTA